MSASQPGTPVAIPIPLAAVTTGHASASPAAQRGAFPPASPGLATTPRGGTRRSMDLSRRSMEGGRRTRHTVEVPEGAEPREGLVVSRQEKFGFIKCTTSEGRYFFHTNDCDGGAAYASTVSFVVAKDLTTGKDVAYHVKTLTPGPTANGTPLSPRVTGGAPPSPRVTPASPRPASASPAAASQVRGGAAATAAPQAQAAAAPPPGRSGQQASTAGLATAASSSFFRSDSTDSFGAAATAAIAASADGPAAADQVSEAGAPGSGTPGGAQQHGPQQHQHQHQRVTATQHQGGMQQGQQGQQAQGPPRRQPVQGQAPFQEVGYVRPGFEHFGQGHHRSPSPATQRDWRLPAREANAVAQEQPPRRNGGGAAMTSEHDASPSPSPAGNGAPAAATPPGIAPPPPPPASQAARYRGTVAQVARAGRHHQMDDGLLLYVDEQGAQQQARYGTWRMAEGCPRLEPGDTVEFEVAHFPGAPSGHRKAAAAVCFLSKSLQPTPSLEAAAAAAAAAASGGGGSGGAGAGAGAGDSMRGRQLGRVQLLKKEFGFIRQVDRLGDMFFHFSQLDGWTADEVKPGDDVEYTIRRDRDGKLSAVQIRRAAPGSVVFEVVGEELLRGTILERPITGKQYMGTSGVLEYSIGPQGDEAAASEAGLPPLGLPPGKLRLPFTPQDVQQGSGSLRAGDHVSFRIATNLQAAKAAALASVPGAALYAGKRAVAVSLVRYAGTVVQVNKERLFGFVAYSEDQMLVGPAHATAPSPPAAATEPGPLAPPAARAPESDQQQAPADGTPAAAGEGTEPPAGASSPLVQAVEGRAVAAVSAAITAASDKIKEVAAGPVTEDSASEVAAQADASASASAATPPSQPELPKRRLFFHFKEVAGQHLLKPGDEVVFVLHTNMKTGELNAQRVRRTKEGPELPPEPEKAPAPRPAPVPAVNPNRNKYSGNLRTGSYKQPKIAKGPDGTIGFDFPRPNAVMPPLPGLEPRPEPEPEAEAEDGAGEDEAVPGALPTGADLQAGSPFAALAASVPAGGPAELTAEQALQELKLETVLSVGASVFVPNLANFDLSVLSSSGSSKQS